MGEVRYWLNVDYPGRSCTVHLPSCQYEPRKGKWKNVGSMGRDGGWMPFSDYPSLVNYKDSRFSEYDLCSCSYCGTSDMVIEGSTLKGEEIKMENMEYSGLLSPDVEFKTKSGKVFFRMKRKTDWGPLYYVFEKPDAGLSDEEKESLDKAFKVISTFAGMMGIQLFDSAEIWDALQNKIIGVLESMEAKKARAKAKETGDLVLVRDVDISLFDHGTGKITTLTMGISVGSEDFDLWRKSISERSYRG